MAWVKWVMRLSSFPVKQGYQLSVCHETGWITSKQMQHGHPDLVPLTCKGRNTQFLEVFFRNHQQVAAALFSWGEANLRRAGLIWMWPVAAVALRNAFDLLIFYFYLYICIYIYTLLHIQSKWNVQKTQTMVLHIQYISCVPSKLCFLDFLTINQLRWRHVERLQARPPLRQRLWLPPEQEETGGS